jgi:SAM-dependent methyltransferase
VAEEPAAWLTENAHLIPPGQPVLDVASGKGRNALYMAAAGWPVHAIDRNPQALSSLAAAARARGLTVTTAVVDLEVKATTLGHHSFGGVLVFNYLHRRLMPILVDAVAPGGVLIYETFTEGQAERGHPRNPRFLLLDGELPGMVAPLEIVRAREGEFEGKLVSSIVARRT